MAPALWKLASRSRPPRSPAIAASSSSAASSRGEDRLGVGHQRAAGVGEADAARAALDEPGAGLALERRHVLADRRLGEVERLGRGGERALLGDLAEDLHAADVEH